MLQPRQWGYIKRSYNKDYVGKDWYTEKSDSRSVVEQWSSKVGNEFGVY